MNIHEHLITTITDIDLDCEQSDKFCSFDISGMDRSKIQLRSNLSPNAKLGKTTKTGI